MIYLKRSNTTLKKNRLTTTVITLFLLLLFGIHFFFPRFYPSLFYPLTSLSWKTGHAVVGWFSNIGNLIRSKNNLIKENRGLEERVRSNQASLLELDILKKENENLKSILNRKPEGEMVLGVVLNRPPVSPYDTLIIDRGSERGLHVGDRVYVDGDILIGEVAEVYPTKAKISLFSTPGKKTSVMFVNSNIQTEATGRGGGNFSASAPFESNVREGDTIVIPNLKTHVFGIVENISTDKASSFSTILFKIPLNINDIRFVEVEIRP